MKFNELFETKNKYCDVITKCKFTKYLEYGDQLIFFEKTDDTSFTYMRTKYYLVPKSQFINFCSYGFNINNDNLELRCMRNLELYIGNELAVSVSTTNMKNTSYLRALYLLLFVKGDLHDKEINFSELWNLSYNRFRNMINETLLSMDTVNDLQTCRAKVLEYKNKIREVTLNHMGPFIDFKDVLKHSTILNQLLSVTKRVSDNKLINENTVTSIIMVFSLVIKDRTHGEMVQLIKENKRIILNEIDRIAELNRVTGKYYRRMKIYKMKFTADFNLHIEYTITPKLSDMKIGAD